LALFRFARIHKKLIACGSLWLLPGDDLSYHGRAILPAKTMQLQLNIGPPHHGHAIWSAWNAQPQLDVGEPHHGHATQSAKKARPQLDVGLPHQDPVTLGAKTVQPQLIDLHHHGRATLSAENARPQLDVGLPRHDRVTPAAKMVQPRLDVVLPSHGREILSVKTQTWLHVGAPHAILTTKQEHRQPRRDACSLGMHPGALTTHLYMSCGNGGHMPRSE